MSHPQLVVVAGPNGAGKSTVAPRLLSGSYQLSEHVNADQIALGLSGFRSRNAAIEAGRVMRDRIRNLARMRASFAFEMTMSSRSFAPWISGLVNSGYKFHVLYLWLRTPELAVKRVEERVRAGGHHVDAKVVEGTSAELLTSLAYIVPSQTPGLSTTIPTPANRFWSLKGPGQMAPTRSIDKTCGPDSVRLTSRNVRSQSQGFS